MPKEHLPVIRASEIGEYVYCAHAWWLRRVAELEPMGHERRVHGVTLHQRHGYAVMASRILLIIAGFLFIAAVGVILIRG